MIEFKLWEYTAAFKDASGKKVSRVQQVRTDPVTGQQCRITLSRALENERGTQALPSLPQKDLDQDRCPFCPENLALKTPCLLDDISKSGRMQYNKSILFPNLFPYTEWSAVSLFDEAHHVPIGTADPASYRDSFINCARYLERVLKFDPDAIYTAITQNHLPGAGGSLIHPHLQVHATRHPSNRHRMLDDQCRDYETHTGGGLLPDLMSREKKGPRYIGSTGAWEWTAAFAPFGFHEIWGIAPGNSSLLASKNNRLWQDLSSGVLNTQKFYRSLNRNSYNLSLVRTETDENTSCLFVVLSARSNYAPWVRNDFTGFEMAFGEMATFTLPESLADLARPFWK